MLKKVLQNPYFRCKYSLFICDTFISAMVDLDLDTVDGNLPSSLENKPTLSSVKIEQREPKMEMKVEVDEPSLVGEWFQIKVKLVNQGK